MKDSTLTTLQPLLDVLRGYAALEEVRPATFHLGGRDFIHFHEEGPEGLVADVRLAEGRLRMPVSNRTLQVALLERIDDKLAAIESHSGRAR